MKINLSNNTLFKKSVTSLLTLALALSGTYLVSIYARFFTLHKFLTAIPFMMNLKIDVFGAVLPFFAGLACATLYMRRGGTKTTYALCLLFSLVIAFATSHVTPDGLVINLTTLLFGIGIPVVVLVPISTWIKKGPFLKFNESYISSLLIAFSCIPFSLITVDLAYFPFFNNPVMGGNGLADGVLLSTMYSPFTITLIALMFSLILNTFSQVLAQKQM